MITDNIVARITAILPPIILVFGRQYLLSCYEVAQKPKEQEIEGVKLRVRVSAY